jgi:hypothetical protein
MKRLAFKRKQQEIVRENPKFMEGALPTGRRARVISRNPELIKPTLRKTTTTARRPLTRQEKKQQEKREGK